MFFWIQFDDPNMELAPAFNIFDELMKGTRTVGPKDGLDVPQFHVGDEECFIERR